MYPPIALFRPDLAKAMLKYRIQGIEEAMKRAKSGGYEGARQVEMIIKSGQELFAHCDFFQISLGKRIYRSRSDSRYLSAL